MTRALFEIFGKAGYEIYLVGGAVRDRLLGGHGPSDDEDYCTNATPDQIKEVLHRANLPYWTIGEKYGTIMTYLRHEGPPISETDLGGGYSISTVPSPRKAEITTFRSDEYEPSNRKPSVAWESSLRADLARRDFTINAMAMDAQGFVIDFHEGKADLHTLIVRCVGNAEDRFHEDPLRILRAVRFATTLDFVLAHDDMQAMLEYGSLLGTISRERIRDEFSKILASPHAERGLRLLESRELMGYIHPAFEDMILTKEETKGQGATVWSHTKDVVNLAWKESLPPSDPNSRLRLMLAALLHDIGKPAAKSVTTLPDGSTDVHFYGHEESGLPRLVLNHLRFDGDTIGRVCHLVRLHMTMVSPPETAPSTRRFLRKLLGHTESGPDEESTFAEMFALFRADSIASGFGRERVDDFEDHCRGILETTPMISLHSPLDGLELIALGFEPGPALGKMKAYLTELVVNGSLAPDDKFGATRVALAYAVSPESIPIYKEFL